jgi:hypothetical protein
LRLLIAKLIAKPCPGLLKSKGSKKAMAMNKFNDEDGVGDFFNTIGLVDMLTFDESEVTDNDTEPTKAGTVRKLPKR